jgi:hypothetical protein
MVECGTVVVVGALVVGGVVVDDESGAPKGACSVVERHRAKLTRKATTTTIARPVCTS